MEESRGQAHMGTDGFNQGLVPVIDDAVYLRLNQQLGPLASFQLAGKSLAKGQVGWEGHAMTTDTTVPHLLELNFKGQAWRTPHNFNNLTSRGRQRAVPLPIHIN